MSNALKLIWKSESGDSFNVGELSSRNSKYYFQYNESEVKRAKEFGFMPLENFPKIGSKYFREELFTTFQLWVSEKSNKEVAQKEEDNRHENMLEILKNVARDNFHFLEKSEVS